MELRRYATKKTLAVGAAALVVAVGAGAAVAKTAGAFDPKAERDAFDAAVAKKLGVTTQKLEEAYKAAALERLDAAVAAGRITKEQADELRARIEAGELVGPFGLLGRHGLHGLHGLRGDNLSTAADYLGVDVATLAERLRSGQSLADVAKARGKSVDGLEQALVDAKKKELDQAVKDGTLTDAQRDALLSRIEATIDDLVNRTGLPDHGRGFHRPFGYRGFGGSPHA